MAHAQQSSITGMKVIGLMPDYEDLWEPRINVLVELDVTYSQFKKDEAACIVLMNNEQLPLMKTTNNVLDAALKYCFGTQEIKGSVGQRSEKIEVLIPMEDGKLSGKEEALYFQAFVMGGDEEAPTMYAKSNVKKVNMDKLKVLQEELDADEITKNIRRGIIGSLFEEMITNPDAIDDDGYKQCPNCKGKGKIEDDSYNHASQRESGKPRTITVTTCEECHGAGRVKASDADLEFKNSMGGMMDKVGVSGGDIYDIFFGSENNTQSKKKKNSNSTKKRK